jgi:hypothetical protein
MDSPVNRSQVFNSPEGSEFNEPDIVEHLTPTKLNPNYMEGESVDQIVDT